MIYYDVYMIFTGYLQDIESLIECFQYEDVNTYIIRQYTNRIKYHYSYQVCKYAVCRIKHKCDMGVVGPPHNV